MIDVCLTVDNYRNIGIFCSNSASLQNQMETLQPHSLLQAKRRQKLIDTNSYDECKRKNAQQKGPSRAEKQKKEAELSASA